MKKFSYFFGAFLALIGAGCTIGWSLHLHEWGMFIGALVLIYAAYPTVKSWVEKLLADE